MPEVSAIPRFFTGHFYTILNVGIVVCTIVESYMFPFAVIKWMIILAKYRDIGSVFSRYLSPPSTPSKLRYKYTLELMTLCNDNMTKPAVLSKNESHVSVLMESDVGEMYDWIQLTYCGQDCQKIPPALWKMYGAKVKYLDLSFNSIETLKGLEQFPKVDELILDNNKLGDGISFPTLPHLKTLSLNNNQISDLEALVNKIGKSFPSISYLSLLSNKACPNQLSDLDKDESDYQRYSFIKIHQDDGHYKIRLKLNDSGGAILNNLTKLMLWRYSIYFQSYFGERNLYYVIYKLHSLRFLDSRRVSSAERKEAETRGEFMRVRRPPPEAERPALPVGKGRPLPVDLSALGKHRGAYGKCNYKYTGKHSEGNRFIVNSDL